MERVARLSPRDDWTMPPPPDRALIPVAYLVGPEDGWDLYWASEAEVDDHYSLPGTLDLVTIPWPFDDDAVAVAADMVAVGFRVLD